MEERQRDADRSQGTILAAARDEFAEHGLGGARMDRIAERAGLNKRLIYYYFEDKERLFQAVLEQAYLHIRERGAQAEPAGPEAGRSRAPAGRVHLELLPRPSRVPHPAQQRKPAGARHLQDSERAREMNSPLIATLGEILERGRKDGQFSRRRRSGAAVRVDCRAVVLLSLQPSHPVGDLRPRPDDGAKAKSERLNHMCDVILGYVLLN